MSSLQYATLRDMATLLPERCTLETAMTDEQFRIPGTDAEDAPFDAPKPNRPHFHVWFQAKTGRIFWKAARSFVTRQAAGQWAQRREDDPVKRMVLQCELDHCKPKLE